MQQNMTMDQFLGEVARKNEAKKDYIVHPKSMLMEENDERFALHEIGDYGIKSVAHMQIADKLNIPKKFYDSLPGRSPGMRSRVVNELLSVSTEKRYIRTLDGDIRAVLGDRFKPVDDFLILQAVLPVFKDHADLQIHSAQISDGRMYLQVSFPKLEGEVAVGDVIRAGAILVNSEVGLGAVDVKRVIWRLKCRNGMIGESMMRAYHVGRRAGEFSEDYDVFSDDTLKVELLSFQLRLRDVFKASLTEANFALQLDTLRKVAGQIIAPDVVEPLVEKVVDRFLFSKDEGKQILANLWADKDTSRWGLANAVTALVHNTNDVDRQFDIERAGHDLISISDHDWLALAAV